MNANLAQELVHDPYLDHFGLTINTRLRAILCKSHSIALTGPARHIKDKHGEGKLGTVNPDKLQAICKMHGIGVVPVIEAAVEAIVSYDGIDIQEGVGCHLCGYVATTVVAINEHYNKVHGSQEPKLHAPCSYQQLNSGQSHKTKFRVHPKIIPEPPTTLEAMMLGVREAVTSTATRSQSTVNSRAINPWLLASSFHTHVGDHKVAELIALTAGGEDAKTTRIRKVVRKYYDRATDQLAATHVLVKQMLNSPDPGKRSGPL